jgi:hypothetical protein
MGEFLESRYAHRTPVEPRPEGSWEPEPAGESVEDALQAVLRHFAGHFHTLSSLLFERSGGLDGSVLLLFRIGPGYILPVGLPTPLVALAVARPRPGHQRDGVYGSELVFQRLAMAPVTDLFLDGHRWNRATAAGRDLRRTGPPADHYTEAQTACQKACASSSWSMSLCAPDGPLPVMMTALASRFQTAPGVKP